MYSTALALELFCIRMNDVFKLTCMSFLLYIEIILKCDIVLCILCAFIFQIYNRDKLLPETAADVGWMGDKMTASSTTDSKFQVSFYKSKRQVLASNTEWQKFNFAYTTKKPLAATKTK